MKKENKALKIIGRFFASVLIPLLVAIIIGSTLFTSVRMMFTVDGVIDILKRMPYMELIESDSFEETLMKIADESGKKIEITNKDMEKTIEDVFNSKPVKEIVGLYAEDVANIMTGNFESTNVSSDKIKEIFSEHSGDVVDILIDNFPEFDREDIEDTVDVIIDEHLGELIEHLPEPEEVNQELEEIEEIKLIGILFTDTVLYIIWGVAALIAILIFVCRLYHFKGLKWVGIAAVTASAVLLMIAFVLNSGLITEFIEVEFITSIASSFADKIATIAYIVGGVGILFIAGSITLFFVYRSKAKREQERLAQSEAENVKEEAKTEQNQTATAPTEQVKTEQPVAEKIEAAPNEAESAPVEQVRVETETVQTEQAQENAETVSTEQVQSQE